MRTECMQATSTLSTPHSHSLPAGGDSGIGRETARALASFNAHVVIANKNKEKAKQAVQMIQAESPEARVEALHVDLASLRCGVVWPVGHADAAERCSWRQSCLGHHGGTLMVYSEPQAASRLELWSGSGLLWVTH